MQISCLEVIRELSNYIDKDVTPELREQIVAHLPACTHCSAVYDGLRNTITLVARTANQYLVSCGGSRSLKLLIPSLFWPICRPIPAPSCLSSADVLARCES